MAQAGRSPLTLTPLFVDRVADQERWPVEQKRAFNIGQYKNKHAYMHVVCMPLSSRGGQGSGGPLPAYAVVDRITDQERQPVELEHVQYMQSNQHAYMHVVYMPLSSRGAQGSGGPLPAHAVVDRITDQQR